MQDTTLRLASQARPYAWTCDPRTERIGVLELAMHAAAALLASDRLHPRKVKGLFDEAGDTGADSRKFLQDWSASSSWLS